MLKLNLIFKFFCSSALVSDLQIFAVLPELMEGRSDDATPTVMKWRKQWVLLSEEYVGFHTDCGSFHGRGLVLLRRFCFFNPGVKNSGCGDKQYRMHTGVQQKNE